MDTRAKAAALALDFDWAGRWLRFQVEPIPTTAAAARREYQEAQIAADDALAAPYASAEEAEAQGEAARRLEQIAAERRDLARRLELAERGSAPSSTDEVRGVLTMMKSRRAALAAERHHHVLHNRQSVFAARPLTCGARARTSRGSSSRTRGSKRSSSRSGSRSSSGSDGSGEPEPPRRPSHSLTFPIAGARP